MVASSNLKNKRYALISTFDKSNLKSICLILKRFNIEIISTGLTAKHIRKIGFSCLNISDLTKFKEILNGRVKTLHPKIHASLLFDRNNQKHVSTFDSLNFPKIDFVISNLYPFEKFVNGKDNDKIIEMIDIGGPTLLRSAAKNFNSVTTISNPNLYPSFVKEMNANKGSTTLDFRRKMAGLAFILTSNYDLMISSWFNSTSDNSLHLNARNKIPLLYGENPNQNANVFYTNKQENLITNQIQGRKLSYNNILDIDAAINCLHEFKEPTCIIVKHNNPCGAASNLTINTAYDKALKADPVSSFGGIVALNRPVDEPLAKNISKKFVEIIIANNFDKKALEVFKKKKRLILIKFNKSRLDQMYEIKSINGGYLKQEKNLTKIDKRLLVQASNYKSKLSQLDDLIFALKICKHVKSNAIVLCKNKKTIGIGAGQMSRIDACKIALKKCNKKQKQGGFVAASDAFFPFTDNIKLLLKNNCKAIVEPSGSINDEKIIDYVNNKKIPLYFSKNRFFKH